MIASNPYDGERRPGTVGFALPGVDVRICGMDSGETVAKGEIGVIEVKGPNVFRGYWRMPEKTAQEFRPDGFFITGDLGRVDADGYIQLVGRTKDLVISGSLNIYPMEDEQDQRPRQMLKAHVGEREASGFRGHSSHQPTAQYITKFVLHALSERLRQIRGTENRSSSSISCRATRGRSPESKEDVWSSPLLPDNSSEATRADQPRARS